MFGVLIEKGISDWQIVQQHGGQADLYFGGHFCVPQAGLNVGEPHAVPRIRVMNEQDNSPVIPWRDCEYQYTEGRHAGEWKAMLRVPAGGLYRIETGLFTTWNRPDNPFKQFRGDIRLHVGVGDLFVIAGQSNAAGCARDQAYDPVDLQVHLFRNRQRWDLACHPMNESTEADPEAPNTEMGNSGASPYLSFGRHYSRYAGYPVGLISTARGGSPIANWDPAQNGNLYREMLARIRACGGDIAGILWYQGCTDTDTIEQAQRYQECFYRFVKKTRQEIDREVPFFTFQLNRYAQGLLDEAWGIVREVQRRAAQELDRVWVLPTIQCATSDDIHNSALSNVYLGEILAKQCAGVLLGKAEFAAPDLAEAVLESKHTVRLRFRNTSAGFVVYGEKTLPCGFTVEDEVGKIDIQHLRGEKGCLLLDLERQPVGEMKVSFCYEADPCRWQPKDEVTYLPPLAFYRVGVERRKLDEKE